MNKFDTLLEFSDMFPNEDSCKGGLTGVCNPLLYPQISIVCRLSHLLYGLLIYFTFTNQF